MFPVPEVAFIPPVLETFPQQILLHKKQCHTLLKAVH